MWAGIDMDVTWYAWLNGRALTKQGTASTPPHVVQQNCVFEHVQVFCATTRANQNVRLVPIILTMHTYPQLDSTYIKKSYIPMAASGDMVLIMRT